MSRINNLIRIIGLLTAAGGVIGRIFIKTYLFTIMITFGLLLFFITFLISFDNILEKASTEEAKRISQDEEIRLENSFMRLYQENIPLDVIAEQLKIDVYDLAPIIRSLSKEGRIFLEKRTEIIDKKTGNTMIITPSGIGWLEKSRHTKDIELSMKGYNNVELIEIDSSAICQICKLTIKKNKEIVICNSCSAFFHKDHLLNWLKENKQCPVCRNE